jgi:Ni2+-binding GTPase involved in maturation of urease and hydrogenase
MIAANDSIQRVRPGMRVFEVSAKTGEGLEQCLGFLESELARLRREEISREAAG